MPCAPGYVVADRYTLERELGRGATATVWLGRDGTTGDAVAVKILHPELADSRVRDEFAREARRTSGFLHPHILPALDAGTVEDTLFFTQPFVADGTLRERLMRERQLAVEEVLRIGRAIAEALAYAHGRGFVHRDVKPENILFGDGEVFLGDFGIARALERSLDESTSTRILVRGTAAYMSPEQAAGVAEGDGRGDLFSLGSVLYECLAGVPAFIGASPEAVLAQVVLAEPRDLQVYRPSVPDAVAAIIRRCMAKVPADRFPDARALAEALARPERRISDGKGGTRRRASRTRVLVGGLAAVTLVAAVAVAREVLVAPTAPAAPADTTQWVVFPLARDTGDGGDAVFDDDLLREGLRRGRDGPALVDQVQVLDALRRIPPGAAIPYAELTRALGAGRFVRGMLQPRGARRAKVSLALFDVGTTTPLYSIEVEVPRTLDAAAEEYALAAARLLVRGPVEGTDAPARPHAWSVPAMQALLDGREALNEWDLERAEAALARAREADPADPTATFLLAQVRAWLSRPVPSWRELAARAHGAADALPERERLLAAALDALGQGRFAEACATYRRLRARNARDFAASYGLGQCHALDKVVVRDSATSPSGWRFRSSRHAAMRAYRDAFRLMPTVHRGFRRDGFDTRWAMFFLMPTSTRPGVSADGARYFFARPAYLGDTLAMIPYPAEVVSAGGEAAVPAGFADALLRQRRELRELATDWSTAFPRSSEAKEAMALALELLGDPAALDTIRAARALTDDARRRWDLGASEVLLLVRFGLPDDRTRLHRARRLADSLLDSPPAAGSPPAETLELLATLRGRCADAVGHATRRSVAPDEDAVPSPLLLESRALLARIAMRCDPTSEVRALHEFAGRVDRDPQYRVSRERAFLDEVLLMRPVLLSAQRDSAVVERLAASVRHPLVQASGALVRRDTVAARAALAAFDAAGHPAIPLTADLALAAATLWRDVGRPDVAIRMLDATLDQLRDGDPDALREPGRMAALLRVMRWRAQAAGSRDRGTARRWRSAADALQAP
jgi:tRNA A-37 threonylcarbamoyl transferase component Bud32